MMHVTSHQYFINILNKTRGTAMEHARQGRIALLRKINPPFNILSNITHAN